MFEVKNTILGICISLLLIGFFLKLSPKGNLSKGMKYLLSMVILLIIISPLKGGIQIDLESFGLDVDTSSYVQEDYEEKVVGGVIALMKKDVESFLYQENVGFYSVAVNTTETEEGIEVREISVNIKSGYDPSRIEKAVSKKFGVPCRVTIGAEVK